MNLFPLVIPWTILFEDLITIVFMGEFIKNISMKKLAYTGKCGKCKYHADAELIKKMITTLLCLVFGFMAGLHSDQDSLNPLTLMLLLANFANTK